MCRNILLLLLENSPGQRPKGVIDGFLFFVLVCYPPLSPRGLSAPAPGLPGRSLGAPWITSRVPGASGSSQGEPKDPPWTPQGPSRTLPELPRHPQ